MKLRFQQRQISPTRLLLLLLLCCIAAVSLFLLPRDGKLHDSNFSNVPWQGRRKEDFPSIRSVSESSDPPSLLQSPSCRTVEEMGQLFAQGSDKENLRVRALLQRHFQLHGSTNLRQLSPDQFCRQGFVLGKANEAGFGNEMYKILTAAALSVMLNRSLIIGQNNGKFPFDNYISFTNISMTMKEVKHLWRKYKCTQKYGRQLVIRFDNFERPRETSVLCGDWRNWKEPIVWFEGTTDAVGSQFFVKNINTGMKQAALSLFGHPESLKRPNVFGELMKIIVSPSQAIEDIVNWALNGGTNPDIALHMRMMSNRPIRAKQAALSCARKALLHYQDQITRPRIVLVSDTPSFVTDIMPDLMEISDVIHFDYNSYVGSLPSGRNSEQSNFRAKDWGPAPRWVAFVDFFLAARAKYAVISCAHRRVGTTYAQLVAALAATNHLGEDSSAKSSFSFFSSFQSSLLVHGLANQIGWGHVWNRFAGPLSCHNQSHQCAHTPLLPPAWWDGDWQSPIPRDVRRLEEYGVRLTDTGKVIESSLRSFCNSRKEISKIIPVIRHCNVTKCN